MCKKNSRTRYLLDRMNDDFRLICFGLDGAKSPRSQLEYFMSKTEGDFTFKAKS
jgi:tRNA 2-selenouridine synthase SelU